MGVTPIRKVDTQKSQDIVPGDSICNECHKFMPVCWEAMCFFCNKTFCYKHVEEMQEKWVCADCATYLLLKWGSAVDFVERSETHVKR